MSTFELYIHGTPNGHQIWGSEKNHDYINTFYNHDSNLTDNAALQIDICLGDSYYTYIHQQDVYDSNERPGSFFAMTVCFQKSYCTNVSKLYQIFEAVYKQVCVGTLITQKQNKEVFLVSDFESSRSGNNATVDKIRAIFVKNIAELIQPFISQMVNVPDTFNKTKKQFSLVEVDSPLFFDLFKKQSIVVLPNLEPASVANQVIAKQLNSAIAQKKALETANLQLQTDNAQLSKENKDLSDRLNASASSSEKKYSSTINQLKYELRIVVQERDELKAKIEDAKSSIELIDKPVQKLTRLLAGRFPESDKEHFDEDMESSQKSYSNNSKKAGNSGLNSILLGIIIALCIAILCCVVFCINLGNNKVVDPTTSEQTDTTYLKEDVNPEVKYDDLAKCYLDLSEGSIKKVDGVTYVAPGQTYSLSVKKMVGRKSYPANVEEGTWSVIMTEGQPPINDDNTFAVPDTSEGQNLLVKYTTKSGKTRTRTITVKQL